MPQLDLAGKVLIAVGILDIGIMIYCINSGISYSSSLNIFAVVAGIFLMRGSLRAASLVRWLSVFAYYAFTAMILVWPILQPIDLTFTKFRLAPTSHLTSLVLLTFIVALFYWLAKTLGDPSVLAARIAAGRKQRSMRIPAALGIGLVVVLGTSMSMFLRGELAQKAVQVAQHEIGTGYKFHVSSLNVATSSAGTSVRGVVTAWNSSEIRTIPVAWQEH